MPRKRGPDKDQGDLLQAQVQTAACVPAIRTAVRVWRDAKYKGATDTSKALLNHWFATDHRRSTGEPFRYYDSQRDSIETLIYLYEVAQIRRHRDLLERFAPNVPGIHLLQYDDFTRYAIKMATGAGKTKVMALAIAWQYLNAVAGASDDYARAFLVVAPNVIVFDRLRADFAGGRIFRADPMIPAELAIFWDLDCYMRGDPERASSEGALYLTNIQQLYPRPAADTSDESDEMTAVLGPRPPATTGEVENVGDRIAARRARCLVINDEGHHTHDEESEWNNVIRSIHGRLDDGIAMQLDMSATPRYAKGGLFTWTVFDYPLRARAAIT